MNGDAESTRFDRLTCAIGCCSVWALVTEFTVQPPIEVRGLCARLLRKRQPFASCTTHRFVSGARIVGLVLHPIGERPPHEPERPRDFARLRCFTRGPERFTPDAPSRVIRIGVARGDALHVGLNSRESFCYSMITHCVPDPVQRVNAWGATTVGSLTLTRFFHAHVSTAPSTSTQSPNSSSSPTDPLCRAAPSPPHSRGCPPRSASTPRACRSRTAREERRAA